MSCSKSRPRPSHKAPKRRAHQQRSSSGKRTWLPAAHVADSVPHCRSPAILYARSPNTGLRRSKKPGDQNPKKLFFDKLSYAVEDVDTLVERTVTLHHIISKTLLVAFGNKIVHSYPRQVAATLLRAFQSNFKQHREQCPYL